MVASFDPVQFRQHLHQYPELSNRESITAETITTQLTAFGLRPVTEIGGYGIVVEFDSGQAGDTTLFRADFDALPITEIAEHNHSSKHTGVMHACGHDGHCTSLLMLAQQLTHTPPQKGRIILLFQPAEENGTGAQAMLEHPWFQQQKVDQVFAFHNLPVYLPTCLPTYLHTYLQWQGRIQEFGKGGLVKKKKKKKKKAACWQEIRSVNN